MTDNKTKSGTAKGKKALNILKNFFDNFEGYFCVASLSAMSIIIFIQVVFRYVLKSSLPWSEEISRYLLVWTTFFGGAYGVRKSAHIGVEALTMLLPWIVRKILQLLTMLTCAILSIIILKYGLDIVKNQLARGQLSPALRLPMGYVYMAIPVGMAMFIIRYVQGIYLVIKKMIKPQHGEGVK